MDDDDSKRYCASKDKNITYHKFTRCRECSHNNKSNDCKTVYLIHLNEIMVRSVVMSIIIMNIIS